MKCGNCGGKFGPRDTDQVEFTCGTCVDLLSSYEGPTIPTRHEVREAARGAAYKEPFEPTTYSSIGKGIGETVEKKQAAYGDSFGKSGDVMRILYPDGIPSSKLDDALTVVRVLDKLFRIATDRDALGESPWRDVAGYALLSVKRVEGAHK